MFKRIDKKRKKREEEEELGLDQEMKEIMGLNDTDSEESGSESDSSSDRDSDAEHLDEEDMEDAGEGSGDDDAEDVDASEDDEPPISLSEALRDPIYVVSLDPDVRACILCKGKVIKGTPMSQVHKTSTVCTSLKHELGNTNVQDTPGSQTTIRSFQKLVCKNRPGR